MTTKKWRVYYDTDESPPGYIQPGEVHVIPEDDLYLHLISSECECLPKREQTYKEDGTTKAGILYTHNSYDRRELNEDAKEDAPEAEYYQREEQTKRFQ